MFHPRKSMSDKFKYEVTLDIDKISKRDRYIGESTGTSVEGGALNANYRDVDSIAVISNKLGELGYKISKDWVWEDVGCDELHLKFKDKKIQSLLKLYI
jgi:hypothetical protein